MSEEEDEAGNGPQGFDVGTDPAAAALVYVGHKDEARTQFAKAATLDLTPSEKEEIRSFIPAMRI